MSDPKFPPESKIGYSARKEQLLTCKFLAIRKAVTEQYKNADETALLSYHETLNDRDMVRNKVLEYELAKDYIFDDRTNAQVITHPAAQIGVPVSNNGTPPGPVMQAPVPIQQFQPQPIASPAQAIAAAQQVTIPPQQEAPVAPPTSGLKRPAPKGLQSAVAPPPLAIPTQPVQMAPVPVQAGPVAIPAPPPGATVLMAPVAPVAPVPQATTQGQVTAVQADVGSLVSKVDSIGKGLSMVSEELDKQGKDFKTLVGNLSGQSSETNKALSAMATQLMELKKSVEILTAAVHHIYLSTGNLGQAAGQEGTTLPGFKTFISKYLPQ